VKPYIIIEALLITLLCSCTSRQTAQTLDEVEGYIQQRPDSALTVLESIPRSSLHPRSTKAKFSLLYAMALDKNYIDTADLSVIEPAVTYYRHHGSPDNKLKTYYYQARIYENDTEYDKAIVSFTRALQYETKVKDKKYVALVCSGIAHSYRETFNDSECLKYTEKAYDIFKSIGDSINADKTLFAKAMDLYNTLDYEAAEDLYKSLSLRDDLNPVFKAEVLSKYALKKVNDGEFYAADSLYRQSISCSNVLNGAHDWGPFAYSLSRIGDFNQAERIFDFIENKDSLSLEYNYWKGLTELYQGNYRPAAEHLLNAFMIRDVNTSNILQQSTVKAQRDFFNSEEQAYRTESRNFKLWCGIIALLLLLSTMAFVSVLKRRNRIAKEEKRELLEISEAIRSQLAEMSDKYETEKKNLRTIYAKMYKSQFQTFNELSQIVFQADQNKKKSDRYEEVYEHVKGIAYDIDTDKVGQRKFENEINRRMDDIMKDFRLDFPELEEVEYRLMGYLFAGFNANLIATLIKYPSSSAVYMKKQRMKKMIQSSNALRKDFYLDILG